MNSKRRVGSKSYPGAALPQHEQCALEPPAGTHLGLDGAGGFDQPYSGIDEAWKVMVGIEQPGEQHGQLPRQR